MFWTHRSFLVEYIKAHKKIEMIWCTFDKRKGLLIQKNHYPLAFIDYFKHIKRLLKHDEFSKKFCSCNFLSIRTCFKFYVYIYIYIYKNNVPMVIFKKQFLRIVHTLVGSFFRASPLTTHYIRDSLSTYELSTKVLGIIHEGVSYWQLVDEHDGWQLQITRLT